MTMQAGRKLVSPCGPCPYVAYLVDRPKIWVCRLLQAPSSFTAPARNREDIHPQTPTLPALLAFCFLHRQHHKQTHPASNPLSLLGTGHLSTSSSHHHLF